LTIPNSGTNPNFGTFAGPPTNRHIAPFPAIRRRAFNRSDRPKADPRGSGSLRVDL
jgi:hypothetical protein